MLAELLGEPATGSANAVRLVAIDMDGTLLNEDGKVSPRNLAALHAAEAAKVEIVIATGRRHSYAMHILRPLGLHPDRVLISSNGTVTRTLGAHAAGSAPIATRLMARAHLPNATALWLLGHLDKFRDSLVLTFDRVGPDGEDTRGALVVEHLDQLHSSIGKWMAANAPYIERIDPIERCLAAGAEPAIQAMLCGTVDRMARAEELLRAQVETDLRLTLHRTEYPERDLSILDILPAGCSKGAALLKLGAARGIEPVQMLAIGDNWNDVSMLEVAGQAILMENAPEELKALARSRGWAIGRSNLEDGVAGAIESALATAGVVG